MSFIYEPHVPELLIKAAGPAPGLPNRPLDELDHVLEALRSP
jgi:hypothetical protein